MFSSPNFYFTTSAPKLDSDGDGEIEDTGKPVMQMSDKGMWLAEGDLNVNKGKVVAAKDISSKTKVITKALHSGGGDKLGGTGDSPADPEKVPKYSKS